ncbi:hypothetical protein F5148DRAFT_1369093 [Russula earlei]|uniref:Uncharacterized protein n=1 Tax=Russula earlei TaxID=71964 RepID=A0ACC0U4L6_9AGAM|nr:hypothetical protein F5148DRAFT_1369093 [Russula earlei]
MEGEAWCGVVLVSAASLVAAAWRLLLLLLWRVVVKLLVARCCDGAAVLLSRETETIAAGVETVARGVTKETGRARATAETDGDKAVAGTRSGTAADEATDEAEGVEATAD